MVHVVEYEAVPVREVPILVLKLVMVISTYWFNIWLLPTWNH